MRLEIKTSCLPSGENCGKALNPPANVMRSTARPSRSVVYSSNWLEAGCS